MSRLAPVIADDKLDKVLNQAVKLINQDRDHQFPLVKNNDPDGSLDRHFLAIEGKHVLTAVMMCGKWDLLLKKFPNIPDPATAEAGYRVSTSSLWPVNTTTDGLAGHATDQQANVLADVSFTRLMVRCNLFSSFRSRIILP